MNRSKKILTVLLGMILTLGSISVKTDAANVVEVPAEEIEGVLYQDVESNSIENWPEGPHIYSESGIVMDMDSGAILYAKNIDDQHYPASITKVATALIALQSYEMDEKVKFTWDDIGFLEYGDAHIGIKENEVLTMEDAMYGMMLASANEVSHAIGAHMEGGYDRFIEVMNETTTAMGCTNSHWVNTYGLHDPEHYTSARDMAIIGSAAFKNEKFREIVGTYEHVIPETKITDEKRYVHQNHKMIREWDHRYYEYCVGGKTGFTDQALTTLVTFATKEDRNLVAVTLRTHGGGENAYQDTRNMLEYAFDNFEKTDVTIDMLGNPDLAMVESGASVTMPSNMDFSALTSTFLPPTELEDKSGQIVYTYQGQEMGTVDVTITDAYYNEIHGIQEVQEVEPKKEKVKIPTIVIIILVIMGVLIGVIAVLFLLVYLKRRKIEQRRRQRRMEWRNER